MAPRGDFETVYLGWDGKQRVPCAGLDYSSPYNNLPQNALAPGTVNTQTINGVLCSSPAIGSSPFTSGTLPNHVNEVVLGYFPATVNTSDGFQVAVCTIIVTSHGVYGSEPSTPTGTSPTQVGPERLSLIHVWNGSEFNGALVQPGYTVGFVQVLDTVYFSGYMIEGIFSVEIGVGVNPDLTFNFAQATDYVSSPYLFLLDGYMCAAGARFPTGGGTGTAVHPTIAWSAPGAFTTWDPMDNPQAGYNELPDLSDRITGIATEGRSAFIFRLRGITQQDPNLGSGSGLQPFVWYHLWASPQGIGALDNSVAQFGEVAVFLSSDNVYSISMSSGLSQVGQKIISKINKDSLRYSAFLGRQFSSDIGETATSPVNYLASIVEIGGELHYLLVMTWLSNTEFDPIVQPGTYVYDLNFSDQTWNLWDITKYTPNDSEAEVFVTLTTPIVQVRQVEAVTITTGGGLQIFFYSPNFYLFGAAFQNTLVPVGQFLPAAYDQTEWGSVYSTVLAPLYPILELPQSTVVFRGETVMAGHKVTFRRLRMQNDGVSIVPQTAQIARVTMVGSNQQIGCPIVNILPKGTGAPIQTYYADGNLSDEMIQAKIEMQVGQSPTQWSSMATFRWSHVSFIGADTVGSTQ